jgi:polyisoprenoid-binding protein YceI
MTITPLASDRAALVARRVLFGLTLALLPVIGAACAPNPADDVPSAVIGDPISEAVDEAEGAESMEPEEDAAAEEASEDMAEGSEEDMTESEDDAAMEGDAAEAMAPVALEGMITFQASKVTRTHSCVFPDWQGEIDPGEGTPETATLSFAVDTATVFCDSETPNPERSRFEQHLVTDDFFWSEMHPQATFVSTSIVDGGEGDATHTITGDLTIRGVTQPITFPASVTVTDEMVMGTAEFAVDRQLWEIAYPGAPDDLIRDEVVIALDLSGQR